MKLLKLLAITGLFISSTVFFDLNADEIETTTYTEQTTEPVVDENGGYYDEDGYYHNSLGEIVAAPIEATGDVVRGAGEAAGDIVEGAGHAVGDVVEGIGEGIGHLFGR